MTSLPVAYYSPEETNLSALYIIQFPENLSQELQDKYIASTLAAWPSNRPRPIFLPAHTIITEL